MKTQTKPKETQAIQMMPVGQLRQHPQNPRKDLGDLSELTDSIRENGILQNLTITPYVGEVTGTVLEDTYKVIIGHRRLAAAKLAGLTHVPCAVVEMTPSEQIKTMLMENMQRTDLTPLEQADGFQMMLDLGVSFEEVARDSGFSPSTVRRRLKLRDLDRQQLEERILQGATLMDLAKLEQIEDLKVRNKVLEAVGSNNFEYELSKAVDAQTRKANKPKWIERLDGFARKLTIEEKKGNSTRYLCYVSLMEDPDTYEFKVDEIINEYGYFMEANSFILYEIKAPEDEATSESKKEADRKRLIEEMNATLTEAADRAYKLRINFIKSKSLAKKDRELTVNYLLTFLGSVRSSISSDVMRELLGIDRSLGWSEARDAQRTAFAKLLDADPNKALLYTICSMVDAHDDYVNTWGNWRFPAYTECPKLDLFYDFLELIGYQISDEERLLMSGEHPAFQPGKDEAAVEAEADDGEDFEEE